MLLVFIEIAIILVLLVLNGVLAMSEIAMFSARKARLQQRADEGDSNSQAALDVIESPMRFLSTVQIGMTLIGVLAGAFSGATLAERLAAGLNHFERLAPYSSAIAFTTVVVILTFLTLLVGELVPKRVALIRAEPIAAAVAKPLRMLSIAAAPAVSLLEASCNFLLRIAGFRASEEPAVTVEEIQIMMNQGKEAGVVEDSEHKIVERVFDLDERRVASLMTPRTNIVWIDMDDPFEKSWEEMVTSRYSYFPVCRGDLQMIVGIVALKDVLQRIRGPEKAKLKDCLLPPLFVPPTMSALKLLEFFKQTKRHIAIVTDEYGTVDGLVTVTDVLEAIVGDIPSTGEHIESQAVQRKDGTWLLDGMLPVDDLKRMFEVESLPGEGEGYFHTLGGFVVTHLGRIPTVTDTFEWNGLRFEVIDMDGRRVDKVLVVPKSIPEPPPVQSG